MMLNLCKFRNHERFSYIVVTPENFVIMDEIRETGTPVYIEWKNARRILQWADIMNLHCSGYNHNLYMMVKSLGKPFVMTLHSTVEMPSLPEITICTALHNYNIQRDKRNFVAICNGVDLSRFFPRPKTHRDEVIITRVCRTPKCAPYFWQAINKVLDRYPQTKLWIVGNDEGFGKSTERIKFFGIRRDIPDILAESDIFAYAPYPNYGSKDLVVMEALAMGVPCVVSDSIAICESVENGKTGFIVPYGNVDAFADKVSLLVEDAELRANMGQAGIHTAQERFDMKRITQSYEELYEKVLGLSHFFVETRVSKFN